MTRKVTLIVLITFLSCNSKTKSIENLDEKFDLYPSGKAYIDTINIVKNEQKILESAFDYSRFPIKKSSLGDIKIGMTISEAEKKFKELRKEVSEAFLFGWDGGGSAYLYYEGEDVVFGLIPKRDNDTLLVIIAADKNLKTINGLNPNSSVKDILDKYPETYVYLNLMNGWEQISDNDNDWDFIFGTASNNRIGKYPEVDEPSIPYNLNVNADWIEIK